MKRALAITLAALAGCAAPPPPAVVTVPRDPTVSFDYRVVPRAPDVAAYPPLPEHVWVPAPTERSFVVVRVVNNARPKVLPTPTFTKIPAAQVAPAPAPKPPHWEAQVGFAFDQASLDARAKKSLDALLNSVGPLDQVSIVLVDAHADGKGTDPYNDKLTARRAETVKAYLVSKGVASKAVATHAHGKREPVAPNDTDQGRAANRRAVVEVEGKR